MSAPKAFASLSSGLLARKGSAKPAMRRQNFGQVGPGGIEDLGWNDMGFEMAPAPEGEEGGSVESISRNAVSMLSPSQPVVHDQQAQIASRFGADPDDEEHSYDGADLEDETAELWDPEADEAPNAFNAHRSEARKTDIFSDPSEEAEAQQDDAAFAPLAAQLPAAEQDEAADEHLFEAPISQSMFGPTARAAAPEDETVEPDVAEAGDEPKLMRTVADLAPITPDQKGSAWGDEVESEDGTDTVESGHDDNVEGTDVISSLSGEIDHGDFGEEEEATAGEEADDSFDPTANNRFASFFSRPKPAFEEEANAEPAYEPAYDPVEQAEPAADDEEDALLLDEEISSDDVAADVDADRETAPTMSDDTGITGEDAGLPDYMVERASAEAKDKAAFTLRLDRERHLKLRLACALTGQSAQKMVTEALDRYLADMDEVTRLADEAAARN